MGVTIKQIEQALKSTGGFISHAAVKLKITQSGLSQRIKKSTRLQESLNEIVEAKLDFAETKLIKKIEQEDLGAICFYLKCKGKKRGYIEKQQVEVTGKDGGPIRHIHDQQSAIEEMKKRGLPIPEID